MYTLDYFIEKFEAIPEDEWCTQLYVNENNQCCALGHCGVTFEKGSVEGITLNTLSIKALNSPNTGNYMSIINVNDGEHPKYQQDTPKQRVLAFLKDLKV